MTLLIVVVCLFLYLIIGAVVAAIMAKVWKLDLNDAGDRFNIGCIGFCWVGVPIFVLPYYFARFIFNKTYAWLTAKF